jgi:thiol-disulfide isomerase/thioredoxin
MRFILSIFFTLTISTLSASEAVIKGTIRGFEGKTVLLTVIDDYFTNTERKIGTTLITNESFQLSSPTTGVQQARLTIEDKSVTFYIEQGRVYNIHLSFDEEWNRSKIYDKELTLKFSFPQTTDINQLIKQFNKEYSDFFEANAVLLARKQGEQAVEKFVKTVTTKELYNQNEYVKTYVEYTCAGLKDAAFFSRKQLNQTYFINRPIIYTNKEYVYFFNQFYDNSFKRLILGSKGSELLKYLTLENDIPQALSLIKKELNNNNDAFAELYLINGLYAIYFDGIFNQKSALNILKQIKEKGKNKQNERIAHNILTKLSYYGKEVKAPQFELLDQNDQQVSLTDFRGKYVYLNFWASWNLISMKQMQIIRVLAKRHADNIAFISINIDDNPEDFKKAVNQYDYPWTVLHYGNDYTVKENYQIKTIPAYIVINPEGVIVTNQALPPDDSGIELFLHNLTK